MRSYVRFRRNPPRKYPASRYRLIGPKIGYLYRAEGKILSYPYALSDETCRDGVLLRVPPVSFLDVYYAKMLPQIRNDVEQEATAVYFDPYVGQYVVVGSRQLYLDAKESFHNVGSPIYLENDSPFSFDPMTYGAYLDPDTAEGLLFDNYFEPDVTGTSVMDCMTDPMWDSTDADVRPGGVRRCAVDFFIRFGDRLFDGAGLDTLTACLAAIIAKRHHALLAQLFVLVPQLTARFRPTLQEEARFHGITLPGENAPTPTPKLFNLFQYALLCGDPDIIETVFRFYERPGELTEFLRHPLYYHVGFYHIRRGNAAALALLLAKNYYPDAVDVTDDRTPLIAAACRAVSPGMTAMLLSAGCDPEKTGIRGISAFDYAAAENDCASLAMLLSTLDEDRARGRAGSLAENLPLSDDNQAVLGILRRYL